MEKTKDYLIEKYCEIRDAYYNYESSIKDMNEEINNLKLSLYYKEGSRDIAKKEMDKFEEMLKELDPNIINNL